MRQLALLSLVSSQSAFDNLPFLGRKAHAAAVSQILSLSFQHIALTHHFDAPLFFSMSLEANHKKQKSCLSQELQPPARFWDNLSKIHLTNAALKELDRRNSQHISSAISSPPLQRRGLITRRSTAREKYPPSSAATSTGKIPSQVLKQFARHGGPDLSQIRGVRYLFKYIGM